MNSKIKILHFTQVGGGVDRYLKLFLKYSNKNMFENIIVGTSAINSEDYENNSNGFYEISVPRSFSPIKVFKSVYNLKKILKLEKPDVVYLHSTFAGVIGRLACLNEYCKVVYNPHGWSFKMDETRIKLTIYKIIEKLLSYLTDKYVLISESEFREAEAIRIPLSKLTLIHNGIDIDRNTAFNSQNFRPEYLKNKYIVGMVGRLSNQKNPLFFVEFAKLLSEFYDDLFFIIVGDGELRNEVEILIDEYGLKDNFLITGWVSNPEYYLTMFNQAVLFSKWEGLCLAVTEYMLFKKPTLVTSIGGIEDLIIDGKTGFSITNFSISEAIEKARYIRENPEKSNEIADAAYEFVTTEFDFKYKVDMIEALFLDLL
ncbi:glycosyltransferase family 4 protein [Streptococcus orisratti]|uniref:glycosyltransferase family 4 protein n=1 Tax=Streptococcus orisratti TaxID=114652 RepID=UPI003CFEB89B